MAPHTIRLFVICVIIVTSTIELPVSAYTIRRNVGPIGRVDDLVTAKSSMYEARTDKVRANNIRAINYNHGGGLEKILPAHTSAKAIEIKGDPTVDDKVELTTAFLLLKTDHGLFKITGLPIYTSNTTSLTSETATELPFDTTEFLRERREKGKQNSTSTVSTDANDSIHSTRINNLKITDLETTTKEHNSIKTIPSDDTIINSNVATSIVTLLDQKELGTETDAATFSALTQTTTPIDTTKHDEWVNSNDATSGEISATEIEAFSFASVSPPWKKYTTIDRKRLGTSGQTTVDSEISTEMDTEPTRFSLGKLLSESPIPSLEKLGANLRSDLNTAKTPTQSEEEVSGLTVTKENVANTPQTTSAEFTSSLATKPTSLRTLHLTSMRAGFLDYSAKPIAEEATTIIENFDTVNMFNKSEMLAASLGSENQEASTLPGSKNDAGMEAQSQLAEDEIKEELMREEALGNIAETSRYRKEDNGKGSDKTITSDFVQLGQDTPGEDLSVKPIDKNSALYTVSSINYKPLKKMEIQSLKPIIRDPDDNSWRNESISSLGIVFKAKPPSKNFTQVLKNKTETLFNNSFERDNKSGVPDLRERLEKIAEVRKSKKKKVIDKFGDTVYSDYEENGNSAETTSASSRTLETTPAIIPKAKTVTKYIYTNQPDVTTYTTLLDQLYGLKNKNLESITTTKPKTYNSILEYYDSTDEYDADYVNLPKIDLKKFTSRLPPKDTPLTTVPIPTSQFTKPVTNYWPNRKPTLQYFPPRNTQKVSVNNYDNDFITKLNYHNYKDTKNTNLPTYATVPTPPVSQKYEQYKPNTIKPADFTRLYRPANVENSGYIGHQQRPLGVPPENNGYVDANDGNYNKASYVIKHYKDFIDVAAKDADYDKNIEYETEAYTRQPLRGVTLDELARTKDQNKQSIGGDYDYDAQFRRDILSRFIDNFNQNSERFKVDFPILYNNSVVHRTPEESGKAVATSTSSTFVKRLYDEHANANIATKTNDYLIRRPCDHCDNFTVELSPAYELHYYVPEQEEKEEAEPRATLSYRYGL